MVSVGGCSGSGRKLRESLCLASAHAPGVLFYGRRTAGTGGRVAEFQFSRGRVGADPGGAGTRRAGRLAGADAKKRGALFAGRDVVHRCVAISAGVATGGAV